VLPLLVLDDPLGLPARIGYVPGMYIPLDEAYPDGTGLMSPPLDALRYPGMGPVILGKSGDAGGIPPIL